MFGKKEILFLALFLLVFGICLFGLFFIFRFSNLGFGVEEFRVGFWSASVIIFVLACVIAISWYLRRAQREPEGKLIRKGN